MFPKAAISSPSADLLLSNSQTGRGCVFSQVCDGLALGSRSYGAARARFARADLRHKSSGVASHNPSRPALTQPRQPTPSHIAGPAHSTMAQACLCETLRDSLLDGASRIVAPQEPNRAKHSHRPCSLSTYDGNSRAHRNRFRIGPLLSHPVWLLSASIFLCYDPTSPRIRFFLSLPTFIPSVSIFSS